MKNPNDRRTFKQGDRVSYFSPLSQTPERREIGHVLSDETFSGSVLVEGPSTRNWYHRRELSLVKPREKIFWWVIREGIGNAFETMYFRFFHR